MNEAVEGPGAQEVSTEAVPISQPSSDVDLLSSLLNSVSAQFELAMSRAAEVETHCGRLRVLLEKAAPAITRQVLETLSALPGRRAGAISRTVFELLEEHLPACERPWPLLRNLLLARDPPLARRAMALASRLAGISAFEVDREVLLFLAELAETDSFPWDHAEVVEHLSMIVQGHREMGELHGSPLLALYGPGRDLRLRRLAARLLDLPAQPVPPNIGQQVLGEEAFAALRTYLEYTRAGYLDLLYLSADPEALRDLLEQLHQAEQTCGEALLRDVLGRIGWTRCNLGLEVRRYAPQSIGGSYPLMVAPEEARLMAAHLECRSAPDIYLIVAHGGFPSSSTGTGAEDDPVARFRAYNLAHAGVLAEILDLAPLTNEKVQRLLDGMDRIVEDFVFLFTPYSEECSSLPRLYARLKEKIRAAQSRESLQAQFSPDLTRLVQAFEDPRSLADVCTLHGLKRYLHQRGLRLGMRLVERGRGANRTVDLLAMTRRRTATPVRSIRYVDFEPAAAGRTIPYPVAILADGFGRQLAAGQERFPGVNVFCYGNEVHYYLAFGNHPAFLRIDFSPPLQGGMIDLEYFGVSKFELSAHPNPKLEAIRLFLQKLELDVQIESTRIHSRYDKERALDLGAICNKAEALFRLAPYLMELDWVIGGLRLGDEARRKVTEAWAEFFNSWGVLPLADLLSSDRRGILVAVDGGPTRDHEILWSGEGDYRDLFSAGAPISGQFPLAGMLEALPPEQSGICHDSGKILAGQLVLERYFLNPLREALERGEWQFLGDKIVRSSPDLFQRREAVVVFAGILDAGYALLQSCIQLAQLARPLEKTLRFQPAGTLNGYEVQRACLPLLGQRLSLFVLRDSAGIVRLAFFAPQEMLYGRRETPGSPWKHNWSCDPAQFARLLRQSNYLPLSGEGAGQGAAEDPESIRDLFRRQSSLSGFRQFPGERLLTGVIASPGRAVGRVLFGFGRRVPADYTGSILVAPAVHPQDTPCLYRAAGVVSTGGGILSHAGLIAIQFHKPAIVVSGDWLEGPEGLRSLLFRSVEYREEEFEAGGYQIRIFHDRREREQILREGDLVVLEADAGVLRVLGQEPDVLSLHEAMKVLGESSRQLQQASEEREILVLRGRRLRARHLMEKLLGRIRDPMLSRHTIGEILMGDSLAGCIEAGEKAELLLLLLANPNVRAETHEYLNHWIAEAGSRCRARWNRALQRIPDAASVHETLALRLDAIRAHRAMEEARACLSKCFMERIPISEFLERELDQLAVCRLVELRETCRAELENAASAGSDASSLRHPLRRLECLNQVLGAGGPAVERTRRLAAELARSDAEARQKYAERLVLLPGECDFGLYPSIGWKAANLAEAGRMAGRALIPAWFVVTHRAFQQVLEAPLECPALGREEIPAGAKTLRLAIEAILARTDLNNAQKSAQIRRYWDSLSLPAEVREAVLNAYHRLVGEDLPAEKSKNGSLSPLVAVRSSALEEDAELAARAGEFETFLFIQGDRELLQHLKQAWSGLWTERAIHNRAILSTGTERVGGGIIVQRVAWARIAGVLQTVNIAEAELREIVVNVGYGLGEGVVSGAVGTDHIVIDKESDPDSGPLRFRYITGDKEEQVVFDRKSGLGTTRVGTLYHQRLRAALEYVELCELARSAAGLENAYGYPLDIEFAYEGSRLWILQVRPVTAFGITLRDTLEHYPLVTPSVPERETTGGRHDPT